MYILVAPSLRGTADPKSAHLQPLDDDGAPTAAAVVVPLPDLSRQVAELETKRPRWVFENVRDWYPQLLADGADIERCHDVTLTRGILRFATSAAPSPYIDALHAAPVDDAEDALPRQLQPPPPAPDQGTLFESGPATSGMPLEDLRDELQAQLTAISQSPQANRLTLLAAAESAGQLVAVEMEHFGMPWREDVHNDILTNALGARPREGHRPAELERLAGELRTTLGNPAFNPDSPQELLRALHRAGIEVKTTRQWELEQHNHPVIAPLLQYKKLSRLVTANGWTWLDAWVHDGRFRPEYVVGGVVTGRWASRGGGALQIPRVIRDASRPDPGHRFIVADAAQLEPRVLAALAKDSALAAAARGRDLYQGIADQGFGGDRSTAKIAMLGAMYGATSGEAGRLMPQLTRTYPQAIAVVEHAAREGEAGGVVSSHLGRSCPPPSPRWLQSQQSTTSDEQRRAEGVARARGRFTRNFVVQGTAAEWALCWLAELRRRLRAAAGTGPALGELVFFLHDEVVLHVRDECVEEVEAIVQASAAAATHLLFGNIPIDFPVNAVVVDSYADAK